MKVEVEFQGVFQGVPLESYYFIGFIISRVGSLTVESLYKFLHFIKFTSYDKYLAASKKDAKIDTLSQENNTYRTLIAMLLIYIATYSLHSRLGEDFLKRSWVVLLFAILLVILLSFAYRKQTKYITRRIDASTKK